MKKMKCEHCYSRIVPNRLNQCPKCGLAQSWNIGSNDSFETLGIQAEEVETKKKISTIEELMDQIAELEDEISQAKRGVSRVAGGIITVWLGGFVSVTTYFQGIFQNNSQLSSYGLLIGGGLSLIGLILIFLAMNT